MKDRCIITPTVKVGNQDVVSKLFTELANYTGSTEAAQELWALSQVEEFREGLDNLEYDENGEPTFDSFSKAINIKEYLAGDISMNGLKQDAGATNKEGDVIEYTDSDEAIDKAVTFNEEHPNHVASVKRVNGKYTIDVEKKTSQNSEVPQRVVFNNSLNNKLLGILRSVGFDVAIDENSSYAGIFNPLDATVTAEGLRTIIQIAKGERGERAFPEEFAHAMIAGLGTNPLVTRLLNSLSMPVIEEVLGAQFESYNKKYNGDETRLRKEAVGKLLQRHIVGEEVTPQQKNLLKRLWN